MLLQTHRKRSLQFCHTKICPSGSGWHRHTPDVAFDSMTLATECTMHPLLHTHPLLLTETELELGQTSALPVAIEHGAATKSNAEQPLPALLFPSRILRTRACVSPCSEIFSWDLGKLHTYDHVEDRIIDLRRLAKRAIEEHLFDVGGETTMHLSLVFVRSEKWSLRVSESMFLKILSQRGTTSPMLPVQMLQLQLSWHSLPMCRHWHYSELQLSLHVHSSICM